MGPAEPVLGEEPFLAQPVVLLDCVHDIRASHSGPEPRRVLQPSLRRSARSRRVSADGGGRCSGHWLLKVKPQPADLDGLFGGAYSSQQAFHRVQRPVGVVAGERLSMRPPVASVSQFGGEALLNPGELILEDAPFFGDHAQQEPGIGRRILVPRAVSGWIPGRQDLHPVTALGEGRRHLLVHERTKPAGQVRHAPVNPVPVGRRHRLTLLPGSSSPPDPLNATGHAAAHPSRLQEPLPEGAEWPSGRRWYIARICRLVRHPSAAPRTYASGWHHRRQPRPGWFSRGISTSCRRCRQVRRIAPCDSRPAG
jgi:hypothetical protein